MSEENKNVLGQVRKTNLQIGDTEFTFSLTRGQIADLTNDIGMINAKNADLSRKWALKAVDSGQREKLLSILNDQGNMSLEIDIMSVLTPFFRKNSVSVGKLIPIS